MTTFHYQALEAGGNTVEGVIEAEDRKNALQALGRRGLFPSSLEAAAAEAPVETPQAESEAEAADAPSEG